MHIETAPARNLETAGSTNGIVWTEHRNRKCVSGSARRIGWDGEHYLEQCKAACIATPGCTAVVMSSICGLRNLSGFDVASCDSSRWYDTWTLQTWEACESVSTVTKKCPSWCRSMSNGSCKDCALCKNSGDPTCECPVKEKRSWLAKYWWVLALGAVTVIATGVVISWWYWCWTASFCRTTV